MNIEKHFELLGKKVSDKVTNFTGVVSSISFDLYGCIQAIVTPPAGENGKQEDSRWYDISRLKVLDEKRVMSLPDYENVYIENGDKGPAEKPHGKW